MSKRTQPFFLGGEWKSTNATAEKTNPFDGSVIGSFCLASQKDADRAVDLACEGFEETRRLPGYKRSQILRAVSEKINSQKEQLAECITREVGKSIRFSRGEVDRAVVTFGLAAEEAKRIGGETLPLDLNAGSEGRFGIVRRFPIGVVLAICPFNYPLNLAAHKIGPAMAVGNAVIFKPAPQAPLTGLELARIIESAGYPVKAMSTIPCDNTVAEQLVRDERIAMLSFTGSAAVGWKLKQIAGKKKILLELGGNAGAIIDESADLEDAVRKNVLGSFVYSGQVCIKVQRIFVHERIFENYVQQFVQATKSLKTGDPMNEETVVGPLIDDGAAVRVEEWIHEAVESGAKVLTGGSRKDRTIQPTVLVDAGRDVKVNCQEVFGPVVTLQPFTKFDEAVDSINDSRFGLQAGVFSNDYRNILRAYEKIDTGAVIVNDNPTYRIDHMPYGGIKDSGFGREGVKYTIDAMTEPKLLVMNPPLQ